MRLRCTLIGVMIAPIPFACLPAQQWGVAVAHAWSVQNDNHRYAWPPGSGAPGYFARADLTGGVLYRHRRMKGITLQPELWLTTKGTGYRSNTSTEVWIRYLEMPLTARMFGVRSGTRAVRPSLIIGLSPSVLVSCHWRPHGSRDLACSDTASTISYRGQDRHYPRTDLGVVLGAGLEGRNHRNRLLGLDLRWTLGRRDLEDRRADLYRHNWQMMLAVTYLH